MTRTHVEQKERVGHRPETYLVILGHRSMGERAVLLRPRRGPAVSTHQAAYCSIYRKEKLAGMSETVTDGVSASRQKDRMDLLRQTGHFLLRDQS